MIEPWTRWVLRHRKSVLAVWIGLFVIGGWAASGLADLLTNRFTLPGTDAGRAETILHDHFGQKSTGSFTLVARTDGNAVVDRARVARRGHARGEASAHGPLRQRPSSVAARRDCVDRLVARSGGREGPHGRDAPCGRDDPGRNRLRHRPGGDRARSRPRLLARPQGRRAVHRDPDRLLLLIFVFGTLSFLLPLMFAGVSIPVTLGVVWIFAKNMEISTYTQNMVMLIGLGIAVDYSLLMVYRYREEHQVRPSREEAVIRTMATAGRAVVFSGTAVAVGLSLLLFMPLPFMRGFGVCLAIPLVSVVCALTFLPVLLYYLGDRLDRVRLVPRRLLERRADEEHNMWARLARTIMRRPVLVAVAAIVLLLAAASPVLAFSSGLDRTGGSRRTSRRWRATTCSPRLSVPARSLRRTVYSKDPETGVKSVRDIKEQEVFFGEIPLMTENGTFIINGTERVIVSSCTARPACFSNAFRRKATSSARSSRTGELGRI